jgi:hypothetical protein
VESAEKESINGKKPYTKLKKRARCKAFVISLHFGSLMRDPSRADSPHSCRRKRKSSGFRARLSSPASSFKIVDLLHQYSAQKWTFQEDFMRCMGKRSLS